MGFVLRDKTRKAEHQGSNEPLGELKWPLSACSSCSGRAQACLGSG